MVGPNRNFCGSDKCAVKAGCATAHGLIKTWGFVVCVCESISNTTNVPSLINSPSYQVQWPVFISETRQNGENNPFYQIFLVCLKYTFAFSV